LCWITHQSFSRSTRIGVEEPRLFLHENCSKLRANRIEGSRSFSKSTSAAAHKPSLRCGVGQKCTGAYASGSGVLQRRVGANLRPASNFFEPRRRARRRKVQRAPNFLSQKKWPVHEGRCTLTARKGRGRSDTETGCWNRLVRAREQPKTPSDACVTGKVDCRQSSTPGKRERPRASATLRCGSPSAASPQARALLVALRYISSPASMQHASCAHVLLSPPATPSFTLVKGPRLVLSSPRTLDSTPTTPDARHVHHTAHFARAPRDAAGLGV
jgi:hypothetical protein